MDVFLGEDSFTKIVPAKFSVFERHIFMVVIRGRVQWI